MLKYILLANAKINKQEEKGHASNFKNQWTGGSFF